MSLASCGLARRSRAACGWSSTRAHHCRRSLGSPQPNRTAAASSSFALTIDRRGLALEVRAADDALPVLHALFGVPA